jgi:hypothetical protein
LLILTPQHLANLRAALRYWQDELGPHGPPAMLPYWDAPQLNPLPVAEIAALRSALQAESLRYALYDRGQANLVTTRLFLADESSLPDAATAAEWATVLLPFVSARGGLAAS